MTTPPTGKLSYDKVCFWLGNAYDTFGHELETTGHGTLVNRLCNRSWFSSVDLRHAELAIIFYPSRSLW